MTKKIFRSIICVSVVTFLACFVFIMGILYDYFNAQLISELKSEAVLTEYGIENYGEDYLKGLKYDNRITWIDSDGSVIYDSDADAASLENHAEREEVAEAFEKGSGSSQRYSDTFAERNVYYAKLMDDGTVIRIASSQYTVWTLLLAMIQPMIFVLIIVIILSVILASKLSKKIVKPINELDLDHPDIDGDYPEISPLLKKISRQNMLIDRQMRTLKRNEEEFTAITSNMSEGLIIIDRGTAVLSCNRGALKLLGKDEAKTGESVFVLNRSENFRKAIEGALSGEHKETLMECGSRIYQLLANPVYEGGSINGAVILIMDVTEKEKQEEMRREFTSNVSHELKTPLTSIYGISEIMVNGIVKPEDMGRFAENIHSESGRLITLVNDIIKLSQLDENSVTTEREDVDMLALAKDAAFRLKTVADDNNVTVSVSGEKLIINGIRSVLDEIVYNLCENGIKYNKPGGRVDIFVGVENGRRVLKVSDTGIGIPQEDRARIFERFYRVDKSHSRKIGGTGLGLSIVKHGAAYHNASVEVESKVNEGSCFTVVFAENK
ncbi:MAG: ATP-binding protein [Clostridia bacterium]|nr:ATP-binding protein [Clostridia bacterium]